MRPPSIPSLVAAALSLLAVPTLAQEAPADPPTSPAAAGPTVSALNAELRGIAAHAEAVRRDVTQADRETLRAFLARPDVRTALATRGLEPARLDHRLATLPPERLAELARHVEAARAPDAAAADPELVGGQYVVISTTAIIIALLVLILIEM